MQKQLLNKILVFIFLFTPALLKAQDCATFKEWHALKSAQPLPTASVAERASYNNNLWHAVNHTGELIFESYLASQYNSKEVDLCIKSEDDKLDLQISLTKAFLWGTIEKLKQSESEKIASFAKSIEERLNRTNLPDFRLVGHLNIDPDLPYRGGFHRGQKSVFLNFDLISPNEWYIIFIHEFSHYMDDELRSSTDIYNRKDDVKRIAEAVRSSGCLQDLSPEIRSLLDSWLIAGLNRGFLAEYRAWTKTIDLYLEGLKINSWQEIPLLESFLSSYDQDENLSSYVFKKLDRQFADPNEGIFSLKIIQETLSIVRDDLRKTHR